MPFFISGEPPNNSMVVSPQLKGDSTTGGFVGLGTASPERLAADEVLEGRRDVAPDVLGSDGVPLDQALDGRDTMARDRFRVDHDHARAPPSVGRPS